MHKKLFQNALTLLQTLIAIPSFSKEESGTASAIEDFFKKHGVAPNRAGNNIWVKNKHFDPVKPTILLNSHHDTVRPNAGYTRDPFLAEIKESKLFGLGSNDAGGPLVALIATFLHYHDRNDLQYNLVMAASAEEEISGTGGIESIWSSLPRIDFAIVGEPTLCDMATAEKGLMVLDCVAKGKPGHAARDEGINAIYVALKDIEWFRSYKFPTVSQTLGEMKMSVTIINSGKAKNMLDRKRTKMFAQWNTYGQLPSLDAKKVYRIALWFGSIANAPPIAPFGQNHAAVVLTGTGNNVLFFEPNYGFYEATDLVKSRKQLLEDSISGLYAPDVAVNFIYKVGKTVK